MFDDILYDLLDPRRNGFAFLDGVSDIFPRHVQAELLKLPRNDNDLANRVS
jgi:hypothetical protein